MRHSTMLRASAAMVQSIGAIRSALSRHSSARCSQLRTEVPEARDPRRGFSVSPEEHDETMKTETTTAAKTHRSGAVQLRLLSGRTARPDWVLDERTRAVGRQGVAQAKEILRRLAPPEGVRKAS